MDSWEASDERFVSKYAENLPFVDSGKKIANDPKDWKCEASGDTTNLWLNLSTGYIGGGRKFWDGSGGSGAALEHYIATGKKYPLCVKLGTITSQGGDVWSYAEDEDTLVIDPHLAEHLSRWGINIMSLEKTEKTMSELEVDLNQNYNWSQSVGDGQKQLAVAGPGLKGLVNIGSTCYMNSILQLCFSIPEVREEIPNPR